MNRQDVSEFNGSETLGRRRLIVLARLAADWYWQLDAQLKYVFCDGTDFNISGNPFQDRKGLHRIEFLTENFDPHPEIDAHARALENRESIDQVLTLNHEGQTLHVRVVAEPDYDNHGRFLGYLGCSRDITDHVLIEGQLAHLAKHDDLTGVLNRREFERQLGLVCENLGHSDQVRSLCFIDLDKFKNVNDSAGHAAGDQLLRELADLMRKHVRADEYMGRLGGDEFCLLLNADGEAAKKIADAIINAIVLYSFSWEGQQFKIGASIGITQLDEEIESVDQLMSIADNACYTAKNNGRNQSYFSNECSVSQRLTLQRLSMIRNALKSNCYRLLMQPIVSANQSDDTARYEVLLRLECEDGELLEPSDFLPMAKQYDLMRELDYWVVSNSLSALEKLTLNEQEGKGDSQQQSKIAFNINLSASSLGDRVTLDRILKRVESSSIPHDSLCLEINETTAIRNLSELIQFMDSLSALGVQFALDDFGRGQSSMVDVLKLPIDYLKIDHALITQLLHDPCVRTIVESMHMLSKRLGIKTVAEAVEDNATAQMLHTIGIDYIQGFAISSLIDMQDLLQGRSQHVALKEFAYLPNTLV